MKDLRKLLLPLRIPVARNQMTEGTSVPFLVYISNGTENQSADNVVWNSFNDFRIELYTNKKEGLLEEQIEKLLTENEIYWEKTGDIKVESEALWLTVYYV